MHTDTDTPSGSAAPPLQRRRAARRTKRWIWFAIVSLVALLPCYWQPRIQAGDLSSHIYNAWLTRQVESGRIDGVLVVRQTTNVLFDYMLGGFYRMFGAEAAQRLAVSLAVLIFLWGSYSFICVIARRYAWNIVPCLIMLAYGWVFHMGLFNFYMSLGICFMAMALAWRPTPTRIVAAVALLALAFTAHALPIAWAAGLTAYAWVARRLTARHRVFLAAGSVMAVFVLREMLAARFLTRWSTSQMMAFSGAEQVRLFGPKYYLVLAGVALMWGLLFIRVLRFWGPRRTVMSVPFQLCVIGAATVFLLPGAVLLPGFNHMLAYVGERMSLGVAVCVCALLAVARPRMFEHGVTAVVVLTFFGFLYVDERSLNRFEDQLDGVLAQVPAGSRVIGGFREPVSRIDALRHMVDRSCTGRCYSYANYEPSTGQFRVRALKENAVVVHRYADSWALQTGTYVPRERDLPLYQVFVDRSGRLGLRTVRAGAVCQVSDLRLLSANTGDLSARAPQSPARGRYGLGLLQRDASTSPAQIAYAGEAVMRRDVPAE